MNKSDAKDRLALAERHLERVVAAAWEPTDWSDLSLYGFYCLEAAVMAAAAHAAIAVERNHWQKADVARQLHHDHGLPDIVDLLSDLNQARKGAAYGDVEIPKLDPEDVAASIEGYVEAVRGFIGVEGKDG